MTFSPNNLIHLEFIGYTLNFYTSNLMENTFYKTYFNTYLKNDFRVVK